MSSSHNSDGIKISPGDFKANSQQVIDKINESFSRQLDYSGQDHEDETTYGVSQQRISALLKDIETDFKLLNSDKDGCQDNPYSLTKDYYEAKCDIKPEDD